MDSITSAPGSGPTTTTTAAVPPPPPIFFKPTDARLTKEAATVTIDVAPPGDEPALFGRRQSAKSHGSEKALLLHNPTAHEEHRAQLIPPGDVDHAEALQPRRLAKGAEIKVYRSLEVQLRLHEPLLQHFFLQAARELEATPVIDGDHGTVTLSDVTMQPIAGGFSFACKFTVRAEAAITRIAGIDPHFSGRIHIPVSPLWIESGIAHIRICAPELDLSEEYPAMVKKGFSYVRDKLKLQQVLQQTMQRFASNMIDGHSLLDVMAEQGGVEAKTLVRARQIVDMHTARGVMLRGNDGGIVLDVSVMPTVKAKRAFWMTLAGIGFLVLLAIILIATLAARGA